MTRKENETEETRKRKDEDKEKGNINKKENITERGKKMKL